MIRSKGEKQMILHTINPIELIFPYEYKQQEIKSIDGGFVEGTITNDGFMISRLISTDPKMYLGGRYGIGEIIK